MTFRTYWQAQGAVAEAARQMNVESRLWAASLRSGNPALVAAHADTYNNARIAYLGAYRLARRIAHRAARLGVTL